MKNLLTTFILFTISFVLAQETNKTVLSGNADFYYRYNVANPSNTNNNFTVFTDSHDSFEIGMISLKATHKQGKAAIIADLGFGNRTKQYFYNDTIQDFIIKQLHFIYNFSNKFKITAGSFLSHIGYEMIDATDNKNYSTSYAFTFSPFYNTGLKAQYTAGKFHFMGGFTNPSDFKSALKANSRQKTVITQIGFTQENASVLLNFTTGSINRFNNLIPEKKYNKENFTQFDFIFNRKINDKIGITFNGTYGLIKQDAINSTNQEWFSVVGYLSYQLNKANLLAYRLEYLNDKNGLKIIGSKTNILSNTLSLNFKEGNFTFIPEIRFDVASDQIFVKNNANEISPRTTSVLLATTYSF